MHVIVGAFLHDIGHLLGIERHMERMTTHGLSGHKEGNRKYNIMLFLDFEHVWLSYYPIIYVYTKQIFANSEIGTTLGTRSHEKVGEKFLQNLGFPETVTSFVRGHVDAKRYLVYR